MDWTEYFINLANEVAQKSKDPSTKTGCIIVGPDNEIRSTGYNGFPRNIKDNKKRYNNRELKYLYISHSETNAIYNAARVGTPLKGCRLFTNFGAWACTECVKGIIQTGIIEIVGKKEHRKYFSQGTWKKRIKKGRRFLKEANIKLIEI